jgi:hypothetical protein
MDEVRLDDFSAALGAGWEMEADGERHPAELVEASALHGSVREAGGFRLEFRGPVDPAYQQGLLTFRRDGREYEIFVTALSRDASGTVYEAVFY